MSSLGILYGSWLWANMCLCHDVSIRYPFTPNQAISPMDWEEYVSEIASSIFKEQSPKRFDNDNLYYWHLRFKIANISILSNAFHCVGCLRSEESYMSCLLIVYLQKSF